MRLIKRNKEVLVLTLLVKNEADIIVDNIFFHYANGVDHIIVTDNGSDDGTLEILKSLEKEGLILLMTAKLYNQDKIVNKMGRVARQRYNATVLIHADADEFWSPVSGDLKKSFFKIKHEAVFVDRKDVLPTPEYRDKKFPQKQLNIVTKHIVSESVEEESKTTSLFLFKLPAKVMFSIKKRFLEVSFGNHTLMESLPGGVVTTDEIIIFHFPFKSSERFTEKVVVAADALKRIKTTKIQSWHWKRWIDYYQRNILDEEIERLTPELKDIPNIEFRSFDYEKQIVSPILKNRRLRKNYIQYRSKYNYH